MNDRYHKTPTKRHVRGHRIDIVPDDVPDNWIICNAPRPLYGDKEWLGSFFTGNFYVAINPAGNADELAFYLHRNAENAAVELVFHTEQELIDLGLEWYKEHYKKAYDVIDLDDADHRRCVRDRGLTELNKEPESG